MNLVSIQNNFRKVLFFKGELVPELQIKVAQEML